MTLLNILRSNGDLTDKIVFFLVEFLISFFFPFLIILLAEDEKYIKNNTGSTNTHQHLSSSTLEGYPDISENLKKIIHHMILKISSEIKKKELMEG